MCKDRVVELSNIITCPWTSKWSESTCPNKVYLLENWHYFSKKMYVVGSHQNCLLQALLIGTHNICFRRDIRKHIHLIILTLFLNSVVKTLSLYKSLRKHAYSKILKISPPNSETFQIKILFVFFCFFFFHISAQNIDCVYSLEPPRRSGSNGYRQSMFLSRNKKTNVYPCKPQFYYIKVGFKVVKII